MLQAETQPVRPELVIGLVGATGTDLELVTGCLTNALTLVGYDSEVIHVIELLQSFEKFAALPSHHAEDRIEAQMNAGDELCSLLSSGDALASAAIGKIRDLRQQRTGNPTTPASSCAYVLRSLKRKEEVTLLRSVYGDSFLLIGAFAPRPARVSNLASRIAQSHHTASGDEYRSQAERLIQRDLNDQTKPWGQHVGETFPLADFFVNVADPAALAAALERLVRLLFQYPFHTPTRDEYGMFHAQTAALRSASLARQVGAAITTVAGSIVAVGTNDVPKALGGQYWEGDVPDKRDHALQCDSSDTIRRSMLAEVLERLVKAGWLVQSKQDTAISLLVAEALDQADPPILRGTQVMRVIEYGRAIHAEMAAIVDAALRGVSIADGVLYTTTYPCHNCARHIIAAGIRRVVYLEPYPKILTEPLHQDAMVNDIDSPPRVGFHSFMGVAPRKYMQFFEMVQRKSGDGRIVAWDPRTAYPRGTFRTVAYLRDEATKFTEFVEALERVGLSTKVVVQTSAAASGEVQDG
jgi:cytidine deaminase